MKRRYLRSAGQLAGAAAVMLPIAGTPLDGPVPGAVFTLLLLGSLFYLVCWAIRETLGSGS